MNLQKYIVLSTFIFLSIPGAFAMAQKSTQVEPIPASLSSSLDPTMVCPTTPSQNCLNSIRSTLRMDNLKHLIGLKGEFELGNFTFSEKNPPIVCLYDLAEDPITISIDPNNCGAKNCFSARLSSFYFRYKQKVKEPSSSFDFFIKRSRDQYKLSLRTRGHSLSGTNMSFAKKAIVQIRSGDKCISGTYKNDYAGSPLETIKFKGISTDFVTEPEYKRNTIGEQKTLVLLTHFNDVPTPTYGQTHYQDLIFNKFNNYLKEVSYDMAYLEGDVVGWNQLDISVFEKENPNDPYPISCSNELISQKALEKAAQQGVDITKYSRLIVVAPFSACNFVANSTLNRDYIATSKGEIYASRILIKPNASLATIIHEFGHSMGFNHSSVEKCPEGTNYFQNFYCDSLSGALDSYTPMGRNSGISHFYGPHKDFAGWFKDKNRKFKLMTLDMQMFNNWGDAQRGPNGFPVITIAPLEIKNVAYPQLLKIEYGRQYIYVEKRAPEFFDFDFLFKSGLKNVQLRQVYKLSIKESSQALRSKLILAHQGANPERPYLKDGEILQNPNNGFFINGIGEEVILGVTHYKVEVRPGDPKLSRNPASVERRIVEFLDTSQAGQIINCNEKN